MFWDRVPKPRSQGKQGSLSYFKERNYQAQAREAVEEAFKSYDSVVIELATGLGKTEVFTQIMKTWTAGRCLVIAPYIELISQAAKKIYARTGVQPGIEQGPNWSVETPWGRSKYVVASKDTLISRDPPRYERLRDIGLVVVDEAHLSITSRWKDLLDYYRKDGAKVLGVTATAKRHDRRAMLNNYEYCAFQYGINQAIDEGWLVPAKSCCVQLKSLDLKDVSTTNTVFGADFNQKELNKLLEDYETVAEIADVTARETRGEKTVVYCSSVEEAKLVGQRLNDNYGIKADWIASDPKRCTPQHRREVMRSFQEDTEGITHVCNVGILTTGWDFPDLRNIVMARPTKSRALYTQIFGRGTRPLSGVVDFDNSNADTRKESIEFSDKPHFRMIDLVDASLAHKIVTSVDVMGGELGFDVLARAKDKMIEKEKAMDLDDVLLDAQKEVREQREAEERERRRNIKARADYNKFDVDPTKGGGSGVRTKKKERGARMPFGRFKGKLVRDLETWYIKGAIWKDRPKISKGWLRDSMIRELNKRLGL